METINQYKSHYIPITATAREALKILDQLPDNEIRTLFVLDGSKLVGTLTDGDIRRGLLVDREISENISLYMNKNFKSLQKNNVTPEILANFRKQEIWFLPVLNENNEVESIVNLKTTRTIIPAAALIMAGGRGERLRPLTDSLPKPMLKVGDKPIIEWNIDRLRQYGVKKFYISVKYLGEKIIDYFGDGGSKNISIEYIHEEEPLGTLGACSLIKNLGYDQLLVMNSDLLTNIDFEDFYNYYQAKNALMCMASIPYNVNIPYGVMKMDDKDCVTGLVEKPTYTYYANAGIYLLHKDLIAKIPKDVVYNATDLMQQLIDECERLVHYPILQYWLDIGKYEDYIRAQQDHKHINF
jgi:dTDP-glucose pyrophosphorylase/predicted transcriptional regulator